MLRTVRADLEAGALAKQDGNEPPVKKLAIREEPTEHEKYDFELTPKIYVDGQPVVLASSEKVGVTRL